MRRFIILIMIPCGLAWWFWGRTLEPARVVHAQLEAISQHDYQKAYGYLSADTQSRLSLESFQEMVQKNSVVANNYTGEFLSRKIDNDIATFSGHVRTFNKEKVPVTYVLKKDGDRWVIQDFRF
ncbi:DUF4864 domain-containing protein [Nitrospira sp. Nam74]